MKSKVQKNCKPKTAFLSYLFVTRDELGFTVMSKDALKFKYSQIYNSQLTAITEKHKTDTNKIG